MIYITKKEPYILFSKYWYFLSSSYDDIRNLYILGKKENNVKFDLISFFLPNFYNNYIGVAKFLFFCIYNMNLYSYYEYESFIIENSYLLKIPKVDIKLKKEIISNFIK